MRCLALLRLPVLLWSSLLALLLPVAELVLVIARLGFVPLLHRGRGLGLGMRPALCGTGVLHVASLALGWTRNRRTRLRWLRLARRDYWTLRSGFGSRHA